MKCRLPSSFFVLALVFAQPWAVPLFAQSKAKAQNVPEIPYDSVPNFLKLPPNLYLGDNGLAQFRDITGEIYKMELDGTIIGRFGKAGKQMKELGLVNAIDCRTESEMLVGELTNWRVQKLPLRSR